MKYTLYLAIRSRTTGEAVEFQLEREGSALPRRGDRVIVPGLGRGRDREVVSVIFYACCDRVDILLRLLPSDNADRTLSALMERGWVHANRGDAPAGLSPEEDA